jgi:hypothetical protein
MNMFRHCLVGWERTCLSFCDRRPTTASDQPSLMLPLRPTGGPLGAPLRLMEISDQRLSASQIHSLSCNPTRWALTKSAQRLSASQIHSHYGARPRGADPPVLNAFRHLRSIQRCSPSSCRSVGCAQRLSASQIHFTFGRNPIPMGIMCAQRLATSQIHSKA